MHQIHVVVLSTFTTSYIHEAVVTEDNHMQFACVSIHVLS